MSTTALDSSELNRIQTTFARRWFEVFVRMVWKEFRVVSPFLLVVAGTMIGLAGLVAWTWGERWSEAFRPFCVITVLLPLLFALGSGAMSYAGEREDGTWDWLRRIAAPPSAVCAAKILVGLICGWGLATAGWLPLVQFASRPEVAQSVGRLSHREWIMFLTAVSTVLLLSQIVSSIMKNVFAALIVSGVVLSPVLTLSLAVASGLAYGMAMTTLDAIEFGLIAALPCLIVCEFSLVDCWLKDVAPWRGGLISFVLNRDNWQRLLRLVLGRHHQPLVHLISREGMLARPWLIVAGLMVLIPLWFSLQDTQFRSSFFWQQGWPGQWFVSISRSPFLIAVTSMLALAPTMLGIWAYQPDQRDLRFRFLADRGISPTLIWFSKHLVRVPMLFLMVVLPATVGVIGNLADRHSPVSIGWFLPISLHYVVLSYAVGQLLGQTIRSPITSSFLAAVFTLLLAVWSYGLRLLELPFVFDVVPIAILFAASWLRSSDWLQERTSWRARLQLAGSLIVPFALLYGAIGWYRTSDIARVVRQPPSGNDFSQLAKQLDQAVINGSSEYATLESAYQQEWVSFRNRIDSVVQNPIELATVCHVALKSNESFDDKHLRTLGSQIAHLTSKRNTSAGHEEIFVRLVRSDELLVDALTIVRHLHSEAFRETCQLVSQASERDDLIWPSAMGEPIQYASRMMPRMEYLLLVEADAAAERKEWDDAFKHTFAALRLARQLARDRSRHTTNLEEWALREATSNRLIEFAVKCRSAEVVRRAIHELVQEKYRWPSRTETINTHWAILRQSGAWSSGHGPVVVQHGHVLAPYSSDRQLPDVLHQIFPWETWRQRSRFDLSFARELALSEATDRVLNGETDRIRFAPIPADLLVHLSKEVRRDANDPVFDAILPVGGRDTQHSIVDQEQRFLPLRIELDRRYSILQMALAAWHHEHGSFPKQWSDLIGTTLDQLPLDPLTGKPFDLITSGEVLRRRLPNFPKEYDWQLPYVIAPWAPSFCQIRVDSPDGRRDVWIELAANHSGCSAAMVFNRTNPKD